MERSKGEVFKGFGLGAAPYLFSVLKKIPRNECGVNDFLFPMFFIFRTPSLANASGAVGHQLRQ
jgi:hypothetical protein